MATSPSAGTTEPAMSKAAALATVYDCLLGDQSIPLQLRMRQGLDEARFARLVAALRALGAHYATARVVPKQLALSLLDCYGAFSFREGFYPEAETRRLEDAGLLLQELATDLFS